MAPRCKRNGANRQPVPVQGAVQVESTQRGVGAVGIGEHEQNADDGAPGPGCGRVSSGELQPRSGRRPPGTSSAKLSSETSTERAFTNIDFSPAERPFAWSLRDRFRTTSATW